MLEIINRLLGSVGNQERSRIRFSSDTSYLIFFVRNSNAAFISFMSNPFFWTTMITVIITRPL